ncbi:MAG: hypothetical protein LBJ93_01660 [Clostridiales bacterium]|jgi:hypothetical protein|nr:hypothetical protein [Clostridiales bacterium]
MNSFDLNNFSSTNNFESAVNVSNVASSDNINSESVVESYRRVVKEPVISFKIYDCCRSKDCLTSKEIGPARTSYNADQAGEVIQPPTNAATVSLDQLKIKKIIILSKTPNSFKNGYWDIDLRYVFGYNLIFRDAAGTQISSPIASNSIYNKKLTLFGSTGTELVLSTDLFSSSNQGTNIVNGSPFVLVEAKSIALDAQLKFSSKTSRDTVDAPLEANHVDVTLGLFSIIKLYRLVDLEVQSTGFVIPRKCPANPSYKPCEFFEKLNFPMDIFAPPQKKEFNSQISGSIKSNLDATSALNDDCGCN